jgi:hypothetical protein
MTDNITPELKLLCQIEVENNKYKYCTSCVHSKLPSHVCTLPSCDYKWIHQDKFNELVANTNKSV